MSCFCIGSLEIIFCLCFGIIFFSSCPPLGCMLCTGVLSPGSHSRQPQIYQDCIGHNPLVKIKAFLYFCVLLTNFAFCNCCPYCLFQVSSCEINVIFNSYSYSLILKKINAVNCSPLCLISYVTPTSTLDQETDFYNLVEN